MKKTISECVIDYIRSRSNYLKETTTARYFNLYKNYIEKPFSSCKGKQFSNKFLQDYVDQQLENGLPVKVVNEIILLIKMAVKREDKINGKNSFAINVDLPKSAKKKNVTTLTRNEEKILVNYILEHDRQKYCGVILSLFTGMRIGEICALKWKDIDLKKRVINVSKTLQRVCIKDKTSKIIIGETKTEAGKRTIPINNILYDFLLSIKPASRDMYFLTNSTTPKEPRNYRKIFKTLLKRCGIQDVTFHALRHTFATRLIENKVDIKTVSELLGHSSPNITIAIYVHSEFNTKKKAVKTLENMILK